MRDYADVLTIEQLGALMPLGTHQAGSERGVYIGRTVTGGGRPVRFDITEASRTGRPPSMLLAGTLGSGKTIAAELLALQAERRGSLVVDVDPKPDHNFEGLPELDGRVHVIELSGDERYRGLLDPLTVAPEGLREDLASSYLMELLPQAPPAWETQVRKAVRHALEERQPSCLRVLDALSRSADSDARAAGEALAVWADSGVARLGFGDGASERIAAQRPVTTIKARGLSLPAPGIARVDYDQAERLGVATLKLIAAYAMRLVSGDRSVHKVVLFDEAWFLLASRDGRRLIDRLNRLGRAENATLILATQQLTDVGEIENLIGTRLIFGQETAAEARRALELLGLDAEDRTLVERVRGYRRGRCLMRDIDDRVAELQIEPVHEHVLAILDTSPGRPARAAGGRGVRRRLALIAGRGPGVGRVGVAGGVGRVPRHGSGEQHRARVPERGRPGRPLPAVGVLAGLPRRRRRDRPGRGAADDRPVGGRADLERDELPGQVGRGPVHVGVLARPAQRRGRVCSHRSRTRSPACTRT